MWHYKKRYIAISSSTKIFMCCLCSILLPHIDYLRQEIAGLDARIKALTTQERKLYQKLQKDLEESMEYHDRLHVVADQQIAFDLDDGVVVNYAKFGDVLAKLK